MEYTPYPKTPRDENLIVYVTEKIDGTHGAILVDLDGTVRAASRNRIITPEDDNFGFASWVYEHADDLRWLGPGVHRGEWWGLGIQRGYGQDRKNFSLFNWPKYRSSVYLPQVAGLSMVPVYRRFTLGEGQHDLETGVLGPVPRQESRLWDGPAEGAVTAVYTQKSCGPVLVFKSIWDKPR